MHNFFEELVGENDCVALRLPENDLTTVRQKAVEERGEVTIFFRVRRSSQQLIALPAKSPKLMQE